MAPRDNWGRTIDAAIDRARAGEYRFGRRPRDNALARFRSRGNVELLVDGEWIPILRPFRFRRWIRLSDEQLRFHAEAFLIDNIDAPPATGLGWRGRGRRWGFMRRLYPPLPGGARRHPGNPTFGAVRRHRAKQLPRIRAEADLTDLREQALLGHATLADRCAVMEQRASFFLAAAGLGTSLVLANSGLLLGTGRLNDPWLYLAALCLAVSAFCAVVAGLRAMQAAMTTFTRATPNSVAGVIERADLAGRKVIRAHVGALLVAQNREEVIGTWKMARLKAARTWFLAAVVGVAALTAVVLGDVVSTDPTPASSPESAASSERLVRADAVSVPEVAVLGEDHRHAGPLAGLDHLGVAFGAAGLDDAGGAGLDRQLGAVGEGEEGVGGQGGAG